MGRWGRIRIRRRLWSWTLGVLLALVLIAGRALVVTSPIEQPDVIVMLSGHEWERLPSTALAARANPAAVVLVTRPSEVTRYNCNDCERRIDRLLSAGIAADRVRLLPVQANGTYWEAVACREFLLRSGMRRVLVVTSPYHTRRALSTFRHVLAGADFSIGITPAWTNSGARPAFWWTRYGDLRYVAYEWVALASYLPRYGVSPLVGPEVSR